MKLPGLNSETVMKGIFAFAMSACVMGSILLLWGISEAVHFYPSTLTSLQQMSAYRIAH